MKVCNEDCFHCIYDDCILDGLKRAKKPKELIETKTAAQIRSAKWYQKNKKKKKAQSKAYYWANRDRINARRRKKTKETENAKSD